MFEVDERIVPVVLFVATTEIVPEIVGGQAALGESMLTEPVLLTLTPPKTATLFNGKLMGVMASVMDVLWEVEPLVPLAVRV
jgi:hypothetical protein